MERPVSKSLLTPPSFKMSLLLEQRLKSLRPCLNFFFRFSCTHLSDSNLLSTYIYTVIAERKIKINSFPIPPTVSRNLFEDKAAKKIGGFVPVAPLIQAAKDNFGANGFAQMVTDQDKLRQKAVQKNLKNMSKGDRSSLRYERMLRDSRLEDLSDIAKLGFIYKSGRDINGGTVIVIVSR